MKYTIVITTASRFDKANYLEKTVENLRFSAVFKSPLLGGFFIFHTEKPEMMKNPQNALRALEKAYENNTEWVIFLEDDVDFISNFLESVDKWLADFSNDEILFYPLAANYKELAESTEPVWRYPIDWFYGCQAYAIRRDKLEKFIPFFRSILQKVYLHHDMVLREWGIAENSVHVLTPVPSFIQHIGETSAIHSGRFFQFMHWGGKDFSYKLDKPQE